MTAVSLYDLIAREAGAGVTAYPQARDRAGWLAERLVESTIADWHRLVQYEDDLTPANRDDEGVALEIARSIHGLFQEWAAEAEQVLARTRQRASAGHRVANAEALEDAYGRTRARLKLTPEMIARSMEHVRRGEFVPAEELRDELRTRLRA